MIMSGWILPDLYEVKCLSCSSTNGHLEVVKEYLRNLKKRDHITYQEIMQQYYKARNAKRVLDLEDFAVLKLGWIKVINTPIKVIFYSPESPVELVIKRYEKVGYYPIRMDERQVIISVPIPSNELI